MADDKIKDKPETTVDPSRKKEEEGKKGFDSEKKEYESAEKQLLQSKIMAEKIAEEQTARDEELKSLDMYSWYVPKKIRVPILKNEPTILEKALGQGSQENKPPLLSKAQIIENKAQTLQIKITESEKTLVEKLKSKNDTEIAEKIRGTKLADIEQNARELIYKGTIESAVKYESIPDLKKKKEEVRKKMENEDFKKLTTEQQEKKIQEKIMTEQTDLLVEEVERFKRLSPEEQQKSENLKKIQDIAIKELGIQDPTKIIEELLDDEKMKERILKTVQQEGMIMAGISPESKLGKELVEMAKKDYDALARNLGENLRLENLPININVNLCWNKDFLGNDQDVPPKLNGDIERLKKQTQRRQGENDDEYKQRVDRSMRETGVSREKMEKIMKTIDRSKLSPFVRLLADLLAPIGAMFGGETGDFWKEYMRSSKANPDEPKEALMSGGSNGMEGRTIDSQFSADHEKSVKKYIQEGPDPAYQGKISSTARSIENYQSKYQAVSDALKAKGKNIPWQVIGAIHEREGSLNFSTCLHNGDPLNRKTVNVPAGLGPFSSWESAAIDALSREKYIPGMDIGTTNGLGRIAEFCELYNGTGYRSRGRVSPYVWSGAKFYTGGLYTKDGPKGFNASKKDGRPGTMPVIMELAKKTQGFKGFQESKPEELSKNDAVKWFQENTDKTYGHNIDGSNYDCMTSTHAALGLDYTKKHAKDFNDKYIDQVDDTHNLWNVSMAGALYAGLITGADSKETIIRKGNDGYYGKEGKDNIHSMEYYIEENVMKRVNDSPSGIINIGGQNKLIHYSKNTLKAEGITKDITTQLGDGESAMMGATGGGTNIRGHEWIIHKENGKLWVYESTNYQGKGITGKGIELTEYLKDPKRRGLPGNNNEAIIFAKK